MSFLNQLKSQATALQQEQRTDTAEQQARIVATEGAARTAWVYLADLARQLNVISPVGPMLALEPRKPWPTTKLADFRCDSRKKKLLDQDVFDYSAMGWRIVLQDSAPLSGSVSVNFPPDMERVQKRLAAGSIAHDRVEVRHPEKNTLQAIRFDYITEARGNVTITADHANAQLVFRLASVQALEVLTIRYPAHLINTVLLDEMAKLIVGQPSKFI